MAKCSFIDVWEGLKYTYANLDRILQFLRNIYFK